MKSQIFLFLGLCFTILSCDSYQEYSQPYEMTVTVVDMDGKPIKNRLIRVLDMFRDHPDNDFKEGKELARSITNNDGIAILRYKLLRAEFVAGEAYIIVEDDTLFKSISYLNHVQEQSWALEDEKKLKGTIKMDSLVPLKVRIKTNRDYAYEYSIWAYMGYTPSTKELDRRMQRTFARFFVKNKRYKLDTTVTTMVYSKANFSVSTYVDGYQKNHAFTKDSIRSIIDDEF